VRPDWPRLYAILDVDSTASRDLDPVTLFQIWLDAGVRLVQMRAKSWPADRVLALADEMSGRAQAAGATFIVNDRTDLARMSRAHGVHLGQTDLSPQGARAILESSQIIGRSTHDEAEFTAALDEPVDYIAVGAVFRTSLKGPAHPTIGTSFVTWAAGEPKLAGRPLVAIGGITLETAPEVIAAGASSVAVISDLLAADPRARIRAYLRALDK
jgi:thiamine-phosphate pyrophosphorylase